MSKDLIPELAQSFLQTYNPAEKDAVWQQQSTTFKTFWAERVMNTSSPAPSDDECDAVIKFLDRNGKGNSKKTEAIARVMVPQGAWRRMFTEFRSNTKLAHLMTSIFRENDASKKAALVDQLYKVNEGERNYLTGESGNALNAFLAAWEPSRNLSVVSLNDRQLLLSFLGLSLPFDWEKEAAGRKIVESNQVLLDGLHAAGIEGSARTVSAFCYFRVFKELWKHEHTAKRLDKTVAVTVPTNTEPENAPEGADEIRESLQVQALLAEIGSRMGLKIWLPRSDRARVLTKWKAKDGDLLETLPLNYDDLTLRTIEQIDVLWLRRRAIVRAFEVEHTTSVYSGLLRMADLIALQPNMDIKLHIVAPVAKREKVFQEIRRPVFSLLEGRALADICTYISYDSVRDLVNAEHLAHLSDKVIEDYAEEAES